MPFFLVNLCLRIFVAQISQFYFEPRRQKDTKVTKLLRSTGLFEKIIASKDDEIGNLKGVIDYSLAVRSYLPKFHSNQLTDAKYFIDRNKGKMIFINDFKIMALLRGKFLNGWEFIQWNYKRAIIIKVHKHDAAINKVNSANSW